MSSFRIILLALCTLLVMSFVDAQGTEHESRKYKALFDLLTNVNKNVNELTAKLNAVNVKSIKEEIKRELLLTTKHVRLDEVEWKTKSVKGKYQAQCTCQFNEKDLPTKELSSPIDAYGWPWSALIDTWTLENFRFTFNSTYDSPVISLPEHHLNVQIRLVMFRPDYTRIDYHLTKTGSSSNLPPLIPQLVLQLKDQSGNGEPNDLPRPLLFSYFGTTLEYNTWTQGPFFQTILPLTTYASANGSLVLQLYAEPPEMSSSASSLDGVLNGSVTHFAQLYKWSQKLLLTIPSAYFYSAPGGHRAQALYTFFPSNNTGGLWLAFSLILLNGKNDAHLTPPALVKWTVTLYNQVNPKGHLVDTFESSAMHHTAEFKPPEVIEQFVVNDALNYKVQLQILK